MTKPKQLFLVSKIPSEELYQNDYSYFFSSPKFSGEENLGSCQDDGR